MILRIAFGRLPEGTDGDALVVLREWLGRAARDVVGLESLVVGTRHRPVDTGGAAGGPLEAALVTVWRDVDSMVRATAVDEQDRFLGKRLDLPLEVDAAIHYELAGRIFSALPPTTLAYVRVLTVRSRPNDEARLVETLRAQQHHLVRLGMVASHLGRRVVGSECEVVSVGIWPDPATVESATGRRLDAPLYEEDLADWHDRLVLTAYDGVEITPRLPDRSGSAIFVLDDDLRIVDITASAAATMGWPSEDLVGRPIAEVSRTPPESRAALWRTFIEQGTLEGESAWLVPPVGDVMVRYVARRDVPVPGRHTVLVRRWNEPTPTFADLEAAIEDAFPNRAP